MDNTNFLNDPTSASQLTLSTLLASLDQFRDGTMDPELQLIELAQGEILFNQGDAADSMYIVVAGALGVRVRNADGSEQIIDQLGPGQTVGELALISGRPRSATVYALNDAGLLRLSRSKFESLTNGDGPSLGELQSTILTRWQRLQLANVLRGLLGELEANDLHQIQSQLTWHTFSNGDVLFRQGDAADGMYIVVNGRLRAVVHTAQGDETTVAEITAGETVGEFTFFTEEPRSATVYAVRQTSVVHLSRTVFEQLSRTRPEWMRKLALILVQRSRQNAGQLQPPAATSQNLALIAGDPSVDIDRFAEELTAALAKLSPTKSLNSRQFDEQYGRSGAAQIAADAPEDLAVSNWLGEIETQHAIVVFVADKETSAWTKRCINQADRVLIVANPSADPTPGPLEHYLSQLEVPLRAELVLWHPPDIGRPNGTLRWLEPRAVRHHHHVRQGDSAHMNRLARRLAGKAIGLVLSGGAALGLTQQGVYKAILELGIPLDYVGGVSMGSIMAGMTVTGHTFAEFEAYSQRLDKMGVLDYTLPLAALTRSKNVGELLKEAYQPFEIEDLWIPFFCVSSNLTTAEPKVHTQGSLWRAIRASMAIPGVFLPVVENGEVLVDGAIMDNFPVAKMSALIESKHIISVLVAPFKARKRRYDYDTSVSGWRVLWHRLNPIGRRRRYPSPMDTVVWAMEINGRRMSRDQESLAEVVISPNVSRFGITDYGKWRELAQIGYDAALEPLRIWKESCDFL